MKTKDYRSARDRYWASRETTNVVDFETATPLDSQSCAALAQRDAIDRKLAREAREIELLRQLDCMVEAYRFAWDADGRYSCDESLQIQD